MNIDVKPEAVRVPALRYYETFEEEKWVFGHQNVFDILIKRRFLSDEFIRKDPWSIDGAKFIENEIRPVYDFIFNYPVVK